MTDRAELDGGRVSKPMSRKIDVGKAHKEFGDARVAAGLHRVSLPHEDFRMILDLRQQLDEAQRRIKDLEGGFALFAAKGDQ